MREWDDRSNTGNMDRLRDSEYGCGLKSVSLKKNMVSGATVSFSRITLHYGIKEVCCIVAR